MKKYLVMYYSKTGNSQFLAEKLATELRADLKKVTPMFKSVLVLYLLSLAKISVSTNISKKDIEKYDEVILLGPIWGGLLISPLRSMLNKAVMASKIIHFAVSCETSDEKKDSQYGYAQVLREAENIGKEFFRTTEAFSSSLVNEEGSWSPKLAEKTKITENNFKGTIKLRLNDFITRIKSS
jgi:menaquinone-dependent protoporphyrinogen IX oxidase